MVLRNFKFTSWIEQHPFLPLILVVVGSLLFKALLIYQVDIINVDGVRYVNAAHQLSTGNLSAAFSHEKMLGFVVLLNLSHLIVPNWFLAGKLLSTIALVLTSVPLYFMTREIFGPRAAFFAVLAFSVAPTLNDKSTAVIKDPVFLFLIILSLCFLVFSLKKSRWQLSLFAGFFGWLSILIRPEGVWFLILISLGIISLIIFAPENRSMLAKILAALCTFPVLTFAVTILLIFSGYVSIEVLHKIFERFAYYAELNVTQSYMGIYEHLKGAEKSLPGGQWSNDFFEYARENIYLIYLIGLVQTFGKEMYPAFILPLLWGFKLRDNWSRPLVLLLIVLIGFLLMDYLYLMYRNYISVRYMLIPITLSFVFVGYGIDRLLELIYKIRFRYSILLILVVLCLFLPLGKSLLNASHEKEEIRIAGIWLRENLDLSKVRLILNDERIALNAGLMRGEYETFADQGLGHAWQKAVSSGCDFIVLYRKTKDTGDVVDSKILSSVKSFTGDKYIVEIYERKA